MAPAYPLVSAEAEGRPGKIDGQPAHTREVKLGCVFTQTSWDQEGFAISRPGLDHLPRCHRDRRGVRTTPVCRSLTSRREPRTQESGPRRWGRRDLEPRRSAFSWRHPDRRFIPRRRRLWDLARLLYPGPDAHQRQWILRHQSKLDDGKIEKLVSYLCSLETSSPELTETIRKTAAYFPRNTERMRYPEFRRQHLFVGSGVMAASCKTVIGSRPKQSGMFWTVRGANAIIALRCFRLSGRLEDHWEARRAV